jgi:hypothetical protein
MRDAISFGQKWRPTQVTAPKMNGGVYVVLLVFLIVIGCDSDRRCIGYGVVSSGGFVPDIENRHGHCKKGDVIDVYTQSRVAALPDFSLKRGRTLGRDTFDLRKDEVSDVCDFTKPIVWVGRTISAWENTPHESREEVNWFACAYRGEMRKPIFSPKFYEGQSK